MTVKELKEYLADKDDEADVYIETETDYILVTKENLDI